MAKLYSEFGATGLPHYAGQIYDEILRDLQGGRWDCIVRQMAENDPVIAATLYAIEMLARQVSWTLAPADESSAAGREAEFFKGALLEDQSISWQDTLAEILSLIPWGWSFFEIVYKERQGEGRDPRRRSKFADGRIGWRKFAIRAQETRIRWEFDEGGGVQALTQNPPPDYGERTIPIEKALLFRATSRKSSPEGRSLIRSAYVPWFFRTRLERLEGIGVERDLAGLPVAHVPAALLSSQKAEDAAVVTSIRQLVSNIRRDEQEGIVWPSAYDPNGNQLYRLELLSTGGARQHNTGQIIDRYKRDTLMCLLADFLLLGHGDRGSFALGESRGNLFARAVNALLDAICGTINDYAIPRLGALNAIPSALLPRLEHGPVEQVTLKDLIEYVSKLADIGAVGFPTEDGVLETYLLEQANLPGSGAQAAAAPEDTAEDAEETNDDTED